MRSATTSPVTVLLMASVIGCGDGKTKTSADGDKTPDIIGLTAGVEAGQQWQGNLLKFCWCPPGRFTMGSPKNEKDRSVNEDQVSVTLTRGFWLGTYEVTQAQWNSVMKTRPWKGEDYVKEGDDYAASYISWEDAVKFCVELTKQDRLSGKLPAGWTYRLPTEAQWEYACRAGSKTQYGFGDDDSRLGNYGWYGGPCTPRSFARRRPPRSSRGS